MTKKDLIDKIYEVVKPTVFGYGKRIITSFNGIGMTDDKRIEHVMIGDILDWIENEGSYLTEYYDGNNLTYKAADTLTYWNEKRKPIEDQPDECIKFIFDLVSS